MTDLLPGFEDVGRKTAQVVSYGGGVDSFCMLLEALDRGEKPDALVFADVGDPQRRDPAEWPATYRHLREVVVPFARKQGIPFYWLATGPGLRVPGATVQVYPIRPGSAETRSLAAHQRWGARSGGIQVPTTQSRSCTAAAKVERYQRWLADNMADTDVTTWIGYDASETDRLENKIAQDKARGGAGDPYSAKVTPAMRKANVGHRARYPLLDAGLDRAACQALIAAKGHPVPRKSACVFCPFTHDVELLDLLREDPEVFSWIESWERDKRGLPTGNNVVMGMFGYKTHRLSPARHRVLLAIDAGRELEPGAVRQTLPWLIQHGWVTGDGQQLTPQGRAIMRAGGRTPVARSSAEPVRKAAGKRMELGVHYTSPAMREYLQGKYPERFACAVTDEETAMEGELAGVLIHPSSLLRKAKGRRMPAAG